MGAATPHRDRAEPVGRPGGGSPERPVGLVHFAAVRRGHAIHHRREVFAGDRTAVRLATVEAALTLLRDVLDETDDGPAA